MRTRRLTLLALGVLATANSGCAHLHAPPPVASTLAAAPLSNPLIVPAMDTEYLWLQIVDTVDDYFRIQREERVRADLGVITDGVIDTYAVTGATSLEPWHKDSTQGFERLHATLQSVRRFAKVRVTPSPEGFAIEIAVYKELEDVAQPENTSVGSSTIRHDGSLVRNEPNALGGPPTLGWIPVGRDFSLEQRMLAELQGRLAEFQPAQRLPATQ